MSAGWIGFFVGIFIGFYLVVVAAGLLAMAKKSCNHYLPDIEDVYENHDSHIESDSNHG